MKTPLFIVLLLLCKPVFAQPQIEGGLTSFIRSNLQYPMFSLRNCVEGTVSIAFKLDRKGKVVSSAVQSGVGTDLDEEALRIIRKSSGKWKMPSGFDTSVLLVVPVNFKLEGYNCELRSKSEVEQAIASYQAQQGLTDAILNFYKKKDPSKQYAEEARFVALKKELGYDEAYMEEKIVEGKKKLKDGDRQGACENFKFVKFMGFTLADSLIQRHCELPEQ